jgi:hypothetical protein
MAELAAALGPNVVRFTPQPPRDEPEPFRSEWAESLQLIDQAAAFYSASEHRAMQAEERAERVAAKAMEGLRTVQSRVDEAEEHARAVEAQAAEEIRQARARASELEAWAQQAEQRAQEAEQRAQEAESRIEAAEARAREAEEWLDRLTNALRQKLSFGAPAATASPVEALRMRLSA